MEQGKSNVGAIVLAIIVTAVVVGGGIYYWQTQEPAQTSTVKDVAVDAKSKFGSLLYEKKGYNLPFGAAEIEGYYTTVARATSLDNSTPDVTCSAFVVTDGPSLLLNSLKGARFGTPPTAVIGSKDSNWVNINKSTKDNPIKLLVTLNPVFEGELIGCMSWPFASITETGTVVINAPHVSIVFPQGTVVVEPQKFSSQKYPYAQNFPYVDRGISALPNIGSWQVMIYDNVELENKDGQLGCFSKTKTIAIGGKSVEYCEGLQTQLDDPGTFIYEPKTKTEISLVGQNLEDLHAALEIVKNGLTWK